MSFFKKSTGEVAKPQQEFNSNKIELIPNNTTLHCVVKKAEIKLSAEYGDRMSIEWQCVAPQQYANRIVFQNVYIFDADAARRDKSLDMFAALDTNFTGGKLLESGQEPNNTTLQAWTGKQMLITVLVWEKDGKTGNWVSAVKPKNANPLPTQQPSPVANDFSEDVPF